MGRSRWVLRSLIFSSIHILLQSLAGSLLTPDWLLGDYDPMSEAIAFDTHRFVKRLSENGFTEQQAEVLADEQVQLLNSNLATKAALFQVRADLLKCMFGALVAQGGLIVALVKLL